MDAAALALCRDNKLPILVFSMADSSALELAVTSDDPIGTLVTAGESLFE